MITSARQRVAYRPSENRFRLSRIEAFWRSSHLIAREKNARGVASFPRSRQETPHATEAESHASRPPVANHHPFPQENVSRSTGVIAPP